MSVAAACALGIGCSAQEQPIRVMTWNIAAGGGDLERIAAVIRAADADIIALQEVDVHWSERSGFADQASSLARSLGLEMRFGPIYRLPSDGGAPPREFGLAILSRHPVVEFHNHEIMRLSTQSPDAEPLPMPGFIEAVVQVGDTNVRVFDTHLDYRPDPRVRERQVADMLARIGQDGGPALLMGDLNAPPDAPELADLFGRFGDAWSDRPGGLTYPATAPARRIDYILHSGELDVLDVRVVETEASDHRPVIADLRLPGSR